jgi:arginine/lysine/ornithine decarboxylase
MAETYRANLNAMVKQVQQAKEKIRKRGWCVEDTELLKITIKVPDSVTGYQIAERLRAGKIECEYADDKYVVCMISPENVLSDLERLQMVLGDNIYGETNDISMSPLHSEQVISIREAVFSQHEVLPLERAEGRICGAPVVSCPPAIPIVVSGERISKEAIKMFQYYGITEVEVIKN